MSRFVEEPIRDGNTLAALSCGVAEPHKDYFLKYIGQLVLLVTCVDGGLLEHSKHKSGESLTKNECKPL